MNEIAPGVQTNSALSQAGPPEMDDGPLQAGPAQVDSGLSPSIRVELICIGTELLLGQIVDTNSMWISQELAGLGINCHFQSKVGDNLDRIVLAIRTALARSDAVIICGGLGPTQDDITREAICVVANVDLVPDPEIARIIEEKFTSKSRVMPINNLRQAEVPRGAVTILPELGTAPGLALTIGRKRLYCVPGVPSEMKEMTKRYVFPDLVEYSGTSSVIASRTLRTWGVSESRLSELVGPFYEELEEETRGTTLAFLASGIEGIRLRLTTKGPSIEETTTILDAYEVKLRSILGTLVFGVDDKGMEDALAELLLGQAKTIALAESVTCGLVAARLSRVPGISQTLKGALVAYDPMVKFSLLGVAPGPVVTHDCAREMAVGARRLFDSTVGLAITGVAGPDSLEGVPPGCVFVGFAFDDQRVETTQLQLPGDRLAVQELAAISAMDFARKMLNE